MAGRATSGTTAPVAPVAPNNTEAPSIGGPSRAGATLTATAGTWTGTQPIAVAYPWLRCDETCRPIPGAPGTTYTTTESDLGATIRIAVTATTPADSRTATSSATDAIAAVPPSNVEPPAISGLAIDGQTLTVDPGRWNRTPPIDFGNRWRRCDRDGESCTRNGSTYTATSEDVGHTLRVVVAATNPGGTDTVTSPASPAVMPRPPANTTRPSIAGTARDGETLTAQTGEWDGTEPFRFSYQWQRCVAAACTDIDGATHQTYRVRSSDYAATLHVVVRAANDAASDTATSPKTASVTAIRTRGTASPSIDGTRRVPGHFEGTDPLTITYQWQRCEADGTRCAPIPGATGANYPAVPDDAGHALRVAVAATGPGGDDTTTSAATTPIEALPAPHAPPVNSSPPTIHGPGVEGATLEVEVGLWTGTDPIDRAYRWQRCDANGTGCVDIEGATAMQYVPTPDDVGKRLRVTVVASNDAGTGEATSALTDPITARPPENTTAPTISGRPHVGDELTADKGGWTGTAEIASDYQWVRCAPNAACIAIPNATGRTYTPSADDANLVLRVRVTTRNDVGTKTVESAPTAAVAADPPHATTPPAVTGALRVAETLAIDPGAWTGTEPLTPSYQWQRCDGNGAKLHGHSRPHRAHVRHDGRRRRPQDPRGAADVRAGRHGPVDLGGERRHRRARRAADRRPAGHTVAPTITGTPRAGATLGIDRGHWTGTEPISFTYQWRRCDTDGNGCADIDGATGLQYVATGADVGHTLRIVARGRNDYGMGTVASVPTAVVTGTSAAGGGATPVRSAPATPAPSTPAPSTPAPSTPAPSTPAPSTAATPQTGSIQPATPGAPASAGDLSLLPDSQSSSTACATLAGGGGFRRVTLSATGPVRMRMRIRADATVLRPPRSSSPSTRRGRPDCARSATRSTAARCARALARRAASRSRPRASRPAGLTAADGRPGVKVRGRTIAVTNLPASTGIVELTVYQPRPPRGASLLRRGARVNATATVRGATTRRLVARVSGGAG